MLDVTSSRQNLQKIRSFHSLFSWFLSQAIRSLSYTHLSQCSRAQLNLDFATLLESLGMWNWAIFVLQHNPNTAARDHAVKEMLQRCVIACTEMTKTKKIEILRAVYVVELSWASIIITFSFKRLHLGFRALP